MAASHNVLKPGTAANKRISHIEKIDSTAMADAGYKKPDRFTGRSGFVRFPLMAGAIAIRQ